VPSPRRAQAVTYPPRHTATPPARPPLYSVTRQARLKAPEPKGGRGNDPADPWYVASFGKRRCRCHYLHETRRRRTVKADARRVGIANGASPTRCATRSPRTCSRRATTSASPRDSTPGAPRRRPYDALPPCPEPGAGRGPKPRRPDVSMIGLGPARRYQISKRDIRQRLAVYHGTRSGGSSQGCRNSGIPSAPADRSP
jgi:hypothetical protein